MVEVLYALCSVLFSLAHPDVSMKTPPTQDVLPRTATKRSRGVNKRDDCDNKTVRSKKKGTENRSISYEESKSCFYDFNLLAKLGLLLNLLL